VVDEALAVGDVFFQQKCMRHLRDFQNNGGTILFVSHDSAAVVALCERAILLSAGKDGDVTTGSAKEICQIYVRQLYQERSQTAGVEFRAERPDAGRVQPSAPEVHGSSLPVVHLNEAVAAENPIQLGTFRQGAESFGCGNFKIIDAWFEDSANTRLPKVNGGDEVRFCLKARSAAQMQWPAFGFTIKNYLGQYVFSEGTDRAFRRHLLSSKRDETWVVTFVFIMPILIEGDYSINVAVAEGAGDDHIQHHWIEDALTLHSVASRLTQGISGLHDLRIGIDIYPASRGIGV
jgi:lipopolysaccharide transport system ATP-binding protein